MNPKVEFSVSFINSWFDPPKAKEAAFAMIDKGTDILYAERFGVSDAAQERGKLAVGNVINTQDKYPDTVVASALWHMETSMNRAVKPAKDGKLKAEDCGVYSIMKHQGASLAPPGKALLGALLFGFFDALQLRLQQSDFGGLPYQLYLMLPYVLSIIALVLAWRRASAPQALMKPWVPGER